jgi:hypothetical protein
VPDIGNHFQVIGLQPAWCTPCATWSGKLRDRTAISTWPCVGAPAPRCVSVLRLDGLLGERWPLTADGVGLTSHGQGAKVMQLYGAVHTLHI